MDLYVGSFWGNRQWGKILGDTVNLKIINFPVSFNECFGGLALFNGDPVAAAEYATITDITNTNFKIYMYANNAGTGYTNANIFYLFLGAQQQWGFDSGTAEKNIVILPLPVINPLSGFACLTDSNGAGDIGIKSMSSTSIVVDVDTNKAASRNFYWLVIAL